MRKLFIWIMLIFTLTGCNSTYDTTSLVFEKDENNYSLDDNVRVESVEALKNNLDLLNVDLESNTPIAVLATSTANALDSLGMNIVAVTSSKNLNQNLQDKLAAGSIIDLGSPIDPNVEQLLIANPTVTFVGSNMPHQEQYDGISNLIVLPQEQYADIYYTLDTLIDEFDLPQSSHDVFNQMVETDQMAKELGHSSQIDGSVVALKYAYGDVTIAPDNTYIGSLLTELGIDNFYGDMTDINLPMSKEQLLLDNPDYIIVYGKGDDMKAEIEELKNDSDLQNLHAFANDQVIILESDSLNADIDSANTLLTLSEDLYA